MAQISKLCKKKYTGKSHLSPDSIYPFKALPCRYITTVFLYTNTSSKKSAHCSADILFFFIM